MKKQPPYQRNFSQRNEKLPQVDDQLDEIENTNNPQVLNTTKQVRQRTHSNEYKTRHVENTLQKKHNK